MKLLVDGLVWVNFSGLQLSLQDFVLSSFNLTLLTLLTLDRYTGIVCADYYKVIIFWEKQFMKNGSFKNFCWIKKLICDSHVANP